MNKNKIVGFFIFVTLGICLITLTRITIEDDIRCQKNGYDGTVTAFGIPTKQCYVDNRPNSRVNIEYYDINSIHKDINITKQYRLSEIKSNTSKE